MAPHPSPNDLTRQQLDELDALLQRMLSLPLSKPESAPAAAYSPPPLPEIPAPFPPPPAAPRPAPGWRTDVPTSSSRSPYLSTPPAVEPLPAFTATMPSFAPPSALIREPVQPSPPFAPVPPPYEPRAFVSNPAPAPLPEVGHSPGNTAGTLRGVDAPATPHGFQSAFANSPPPSDPFDLPNSPFDRVETSAAIELADAQPAAAASEAPAGRVPLLLKPLELTNRVIEGILSWFGPLGDSLCLPPVKHLLGWTGLALIAVAGYWSAKGAGLLAWPR
jgi:hypothetical protein